MLKTGLCQGPSIRDFFNPTDIAGARPLSRFHWVLVVLDRAGHRRDVSSINLFNHNFLICNIDVKPMFVRERLAVVRLAFISPCVSLLSSIGREDHLNKQSSKMN